MLGRSYVRMHMMSRGSHESADDGGAHLLLPCNATGLDRARSIGRGWCWRQSEVRSHRKMNTEQALRSVSASRVLDRLR